MIFIGSSVLNVDGSVPEVLPPVSVTEYLGDTMDLVEDRIDTACASSDSMVVYEKTAMKDINHLLLRYIEQTKFKQMEYIAKIATLENTILEHVEADKANKDRIAKNGIVEIQNTILQGLFQDRVKLEEVQQLLATEKELSLKTKAEVTNVELELMNAERKLLQLPELQNKLAIMT